MKVRSPKSEVRLRASFILCVICLVVIGVVLGFWGTRAKNSVAIQNASFYLENKDSLKAYGFFTVDAIDLDAPLLSVLSSLNCLSTEKIIYDESTERYLVCLSVELEARASGTISYQLVTQNRLFSSNWELSENDFTIKSELANSSSAINAPIPPPKTSEL